MKVAQLKKVLDQAAQMYRDSGSSDAAESLRDFSQLLVGREAMTVASFAKLVDKALVSSPQE
jgi:hypothetical protein